MLLGKMSMFLGLSAFYTNLSYASSFMPPNDLWKEDGLFRNQGLTVEDFNETIDEVERFYKDIVKAQGGTLRINRYWNDSTVNANTTQIGTSWIVNMYGGLARRPEVTPDGFSLVICHELGHQLGGYPFLSPWAANEGQSDYFATYACGRLLWNAQEDKNAESRKTVDPEPKALCDQVWETESDQNLCYRIMMGGKSLANLLGALGGTKANWNTPDPNIVSKTRDTHPVAQCRLDTYIAGALCTKEWDARVIPGKALGSKRNSIEAETISTNYLCTEAEGFEKGYRPNCWFKPQSNQ
jgi:hypothetical protein